MSSWVKVSVGWPHPLWESHNVRSPCLISIPQSCLGFLQLRSAYIPAGERAKCPSRSQCAPHIGRMLRNASGLKQLLWTGTVIELLDV